MIDWDKIRLEYITTNSSYRSLAEKYDISESNLCRHGKREDWPGKRLQNREERERQTTEILAEKNADELLFLSDLLSEVNQLLYAIVSESKNKKITIYDIKAIYDCISKAVDLERNIKKLPTLSDDIAKLKLDFEKEKANIGGLDNKLKIIISDKEGYTE